MNYKPNGYEQLSTPVKLYGVETDKKLGQIVKTRKFIDVIFCNVKSYGGTNVIMGNEFKIEDTLDLVTWWRPDITGSCAVEINSVFYEVIGAPENVEFRNVWIKFKVKRIQNGS